MHGPSVVDRRTALLDSAVEYVLAHGLGDLSLHRLAHELGTSVGMLVHWFGTREALVAAVLASIRRRQREAIRGWAREARPRTLAEAVREHWRWLTADAQEPYLRLVFEIHGLALQHPSQYPGFNEHAVRDWLASLDELVELTGTPPGRRPDATLVLATVRGLLLDLISTGERERVHAAFERFAAALERDAGIAA